MIMKKTDEFLKEVDANISYIMDGYYAGSEIEIVDDIRDYLKDVINNMSDEVKADILASKPQHTTPPGGRSK
jgi:hypothetical protein